MPSTAARPAAGSTPVNTGTSPAGRDNHAPYLTAWDNAETARSNVPYAGTEPRPGCPPLSRTAR